MLLKGDCPTWKPDSICLVKRKRFQVVSPGKKTMLHFKCVKFIGGLMCISIGLAYWNTVKEETFRLRPVLKQDIRSADPLLIKEPTINLLPSKQSQDSNRTRIILTQQHTNKTNEKLSINLQMRQINATDEKFDSWANPLELVNLIPKPHPQNANCQKIFSNDTEEIKKIFKMEEERKKVPVPDEDYVKLAGNCDVFKKSRGYISHPLTKEEEDFPLAYSIMIFKDVEQFERLLRAIYMPQNYHCIHVDSKSPAAVLQSVEAIAKCFDNIFLASRQVDVRWGAFTVLEADLICMEDLFKKFKKWRYFINLTGQEFPMKTNRELVRILKVLNGAVSMEGTIRRRNKERTLYVYQGASEVYPRIDKTPVPHHIRLVKGSVHIVVPREFVEYALFNRVARDFRDWVKDTGVPDETFFASLGHSPHLGIPGAYKGEPETNSDTYPFIPRFKNWFGQFPCVGKTIRGICIISVGDLHFIKDRPELFINKFHVDYSPSAYDCLEELHFQRMRDEVLGSRKLNLSYYEKLDIVKNHI